MSSELRPIGLSDFDAPVYVLGEEGSPMRVAFDNLWFWCRRHEQAHKEGEDCHCRCNATEVRNGGIVHDEGCLHGQTPLSCIDVGPFMSKREAERLREWHGDSGAGPALGMEVER